MEMVLYLFGITNCSLIDIPILFITSKIYCGFMPVVPFVVSAVVDAPCVAVDDEAFCFDLIYATTIQRCIVLNCDA